MSDPPELRLGDLTAVSVLGRGAKGLVFLVAHSSPARRQILALKVIPTSPPDADRHRRICLEQDVLASVRHPLLPSLRGLVSTDRIVGFAIDHCPGGNLSSLRRRQTDQMFTEDAIRFYAAELVLALEHLHGLGIVYRDLKPENVLIQLDGHLMLVDFDLSARLPTAGQRPCGPPLSPPQRSWWRTRSWGSDVSSATLSSSSSSGSSSSSSKSNSFVGTEEYVAPEVVEGRGHDFAVDWWGLGVVLYEMLYGKTPFKGRDKRETFYRIMRREPALLGERTPLRDLIGKLLEKDPRTRVGLDGIKKHEFFRGLDWDSVVEVARPPFIPEVEVEGESCGCGEEIDVEEWVRKVFGGKEKVTGGEAAAGSPPPPPEFLVF